LRKNKSQNRVNFEPQRRKGGISLHLSAFAVQIVPKKLRKNKSQNEVNFEPQRRKDKISLRLSAFAVQIVLEYL
jgi:hypothetical protein